jgi:hypothetical protein
MMGLKHGTNDLDYYGVCNLETFKYRLNLIISGNPDKDIFKGLNWEHFAISGSTMTACLQKKSKLLEFVSDSKKKDEENMLLFFNKYYENSDIDMMCYESSLFGFVDQVNNVIKTISTNLGCSEDNIIIEPIKSTTIILTKQFFEEITNHYNIENNCNMTTDEIISQLKSDEFKQYLYLKHYIVQKEKFNKNIINKNTTKENSKYMRIYKKLATEEELNILLFSKETPKSYYKDNIIDSEICLFTSDFKTEEVIPDNKNNLLLKITENIRFKLKSEKIKRSIEIFRSRTNEFFSNVSKFHLPCVRAYYNGNTVYMLPSNITAMQTGINIDYKYFAGVRDPCEIINKYRERGFGTILSKKEIEHVIKYNLQIGKIKNNSQYDINNYMGFYELPNKKEEKLDLDKYYKNNYGYDPITYGFNIYTFKTISQDGSITPYQNWLSNTYYEMFHNKKNVVIYEKISEKNIKSEILKFVKSEYIKTSKGVHHKTICDKFKYDSVKKYLNDDDLIHVDKYDLYYPKNTEISEKIVLTMLNNIFITSVQEIKNMLSMFKFNGSNLISIVNALCSKDMLYAVDTKNTNENNYYHIVVNNFRSLINEQTQIIAPVNYDIISTILSKNNILISEQNFIGFLEDIEGIKMSYDSVNNMYSFNKDIINNKIESEKNQNEGKVVIDKDIYNDKNKFEDVIDKNFEFEQEILEDAQFVQNIVKNNKALEDFEKSNIKKDIIKESLNIINKFLGQ